LQISKILRLQFAIFKQIGVNLKNSKNVGTDLQNLEKKKIKQKKF